jgi:hypothetical protein
VLAVVDHHERPLGAEPARHLRRHLGARVRGEVEPRGERFPHEGAVGDARQVDEEDPARCDVGEIVPDLDGEPRLAGSAHPGERDEPALVEGLADAAAFVLASDERGALGRQRARITVDGAERGKRVGQAVGGELQQPLDAVEVAQPMLAQIEEPGRATGDEIRRGTARQYLPAVRSRHDMRGAVTGPK